MQNPIRCLSLLLLTLTLPCHGLAPGDEVPIEAITKAHFIRGKAPVTWAEGEIYIFECWATWCAPCIRAIPHMDELHDKYHSKGLNIYGMSVWEDDKDKVEGFVTRKGDGMSYPVAFVGDGGAFETSWLVPAGVTSIPRALVVKDGKLLFSAFPDILTEEIISTLVAGGEAADSLTKEIQQSEGLKTQIEELQKVYQKAAMAGEVEKMIAARAELTQLEPEADYLNGMERDILLARKDWAAAEEFLNQEGNADLAAIHARLISIRIDNFPDEISPRFRETLIKKLKAVPKLGFLDRPIIARLQWSLGQKDAAQATARELIETSAMPKEVLEEFAAGFEPGGDPQSFREFQTSLSDTLRKKREAEAAE
ncbi:MAG: TlpA disulfide reductase family protein [Luteolibacter sp.]